jgi:sterol desaturase/sphingolipid hydroxylase (fatty acid hydroxylase superfamily)
MVLLFLFHVLCYDVWFYTIHIVLHNRHFYVIHKLHHAKPYDQLIYTDANVGHYLENLVEPLGIFAPFFVVECSLMAFICAIIFTHIRGHMRHDNRCSWLVGNHHLLHHKYRRYNYGEYWIDTLCGTRYLGEDEYVYGCLYV